MVSPAQVAAAIARMRARLGAPYFLGAKWNPADDDPRGPVDCSGFSKWGLAPLGILLPDGSYNQVKVCARLPASMQAAPPPLCLGFFDPQGDPSLVDHVVVAEDDVNVIEARGAPYNAVIERPIAKWLAQAGFLGFYAPPGLLE